MERFQSNIERFLYRQGLLYSHVDIDFNFDEDLTVLVSIELNRKKGICFFGNHYFSKQDFLESLLLYGKSAWHFPSTIISDELRQMYHNKGFWQVDINTREEEGKVFCVIHEGNRVRVVGVEYDGIKAFSEDELNAVSFKDSVLGKLFDKKYMNLASKRLFRCINRMVTGMLS